MKTGTVKFYNSTKRFGFIVPDDGSKDLFFHVTGLKGDAKKGDSVLYDTEEGRKGLQAVNVRSVE